MKVNLRWRSARFCVPLGLVVGATFVMHPTWIRLTAVGLVALGIAAYYARKGRLVDALIPLLWFAVAVPVGLVLTDIAIVASWVTYCAHHVGSDNCA
jgi:hypothetical protein